MPKFIFDTGFNNFSMDKDLQNFILEHSDEDPARLILSAGKYPGIDVRCAAECISGRNAIRKKLPSWYANPAILYPKSISLEQCSSELTASYKRRFCPDGERVADITGGFGIDSFYLSKTASELIYIERNSELCEVAKENFATLGAVNIKTFCEEVSPDNIRKIFDGRFGLVYADPARRDKAGDKIISINKSEPDITLLKDILFEYTDRILVKLSPMVDIRATLSLISEISEVHILSVKNECKEMLVLITRGFDGEPSITVSLSDGVETPHPVIKFSLSSEKNARIALASPDDLKVTSGRELYLYEPDAALLKAGCFKLICERFNIKKIAPETHIYLSETLVRDFPGRIERIIEIVPFSKKNVISVAATVPGCSVIARNFPMKSEELRKMLSTAENESYRLIATRNCHCDKIIILTSLISRS